MVGAAAADAHTGWVYRSDAPAGAGLASTPVTRVESDRPGSPSPDHARPRERPPAAAYMTTSRGWIEGGFYVMTLPLSITARMMFAPLGWIFGPRQPR